MLAIVRALEEWRHFVEGAEHRCEIWMDHKNLEYFMTAKKLNCRQARWSPLLACFDFVMHHRPGKSMGKTDVLSRRADHGSGAGDNDNIVLLTPNLFTIRALEGLHIVGEERDIMREIQRGTRDGETEVQIGKVAVGLRNSKAKLVQSPEWSLMDGVLYFQGKIYIPNTADLRRQIVALCYDSRIAGHSDR